MSGRMEEQIPSFGNTKNLLKEKIAIDMLQSSQEETIVKT